MMLARKTEEGARSGSASASASSATPAPSTTAPLTPDLSTLPPAAVMPAVTADPYDRTVVRSVSVLTAPPPIAGLVTGPAMGSKAYLGRASSAPVATPVAGAVYPSGPRVLGHNNLADLARRTNDTLAHMTLSAAKPVVRLDRPAAVPCGPYTLTPFTVGVRCKLAEVRSNVERALRAHNVDYEYNDSKWKAKCFLFKPSGHCHFVLRMYSDRPAGSAGKGGDATVPEGFLVELQRRNGCTRLFHRTYEALLASFAHFGVLTPDSDGAKRAQALGLYTTGGTQPPVTTSTRVPAELSLHYEGSVDDTEEVSVTPSDAHAIVEAFTPLNAMLSQRFDDIVTPAAQSVAALTTSRRVLAALGQRARAAMEAAKTRMAATPTSGVVPPPPAPAAASRQSSTSSTVSTVAATAAHVDQDRADGTIILTLMQVLLQHAVSDVVSVEGRTACAMALVNLSREPACAESFALFRPLRTIYQGLPAILVSARTAALRRELMAIAVAMLAAQPALADVEARDGLHVVAHNLAHDPRTRGVDVVFDAWAGSVAERLTAAAARLAAPAPATA